MTTAVHAAPPTELLSPEMELVACCGRARLTEADVERLHMLARRQVDWDRLIPLALRHKVLPLVWWHLQAQGCPVPASSAQLLKRLFLENAGRMLLLSAELLALTEFGERDGIVVVPYKGPALGAYLYGNMALRQAGDLDIVVSRRDAPRARDLLLSRGYTPRHLLSESGKEFMLRSRYSEEFTGPSGLSLELHWAFTNGDVSLPLDLGALSPRLERMQLGGGTVPMFGAADLLLILCVHGGKHRWDRLEWMCGVAELLRAREHELSWDALLADATSAGARRMLLLGVLLAHELLGAPVPEPFLRVARWDSAVARLALAVPRILAAELPDGAEEGGLQTDLFRLQLRERPRDRVRFIWYRLTTPSRPESWSAVRIGQRSFAVHGLLRPLHLVPRLFRALSRNRGIAEKS